MIFLAQLQYMDAISYSCEIPHPTISSTPIALMALVIPISSALFVALVVTVLVLAISTMTKISGGLKSTKAEGGLALFFHCPFVLWLLRGDDRKHSWTLVIVRIDLGGDFHLRDPFSPSRRRNMMIGKNNRDRFMDG